MEFQLTVVAYQGSEAQPFHSVKRQAGRRVIRRCWRGVEGKPTPNCAFPKLWADKTIRELGADEDSGLCSYPCKTYKLHSPRVGSYHVVSLDGEQLTPQKLDVRTSGTWSRADPA